MLKSDPKTLMRMRLEELISQIKATKMQYNIQSKDISGNDKEEIISEYKNGINALKKKLGELEGN